MSVDKTKINNDSNDQKDIKSNSNESNNSPLNSCYMCK